MGFIISHHAFFFASLYTPQWGEILYKSVFKFCSNILDFSQVIYYSKILTLDKHYDHLIQQPVPKLRILNFYEFYNSWIAYDNKNNANNQTRLIKQQIYEDKNTPPEIIWTHCVRHPRAARTRTFLKILFLAKWTVKWIVAPQLAAIFLLHCILWVKFELASRLRECRYETFRYGEIYKIKRVLLSESYLKSLL